MKHSYILLLVIPVFLIIALYKYADRAALRDEIPQKLEIHRTISLNKTSGPGSCGVAVYELSKNTTNKITHEKMLFLKGARTTRKGKEYPVWKQTPYVERKLSHSALLGFSCAEKMPSDFQNEFTAKIQKTGGYYSAGTNFGLFILSDNQILVHTFFD